MIAGIVERGIARGEFRAVRIDEVVPALCAPIPFLVMNKHSLGACPAEAKFDPMPVIGIRIDLMPHGLHAPAARDRKSVV